MIMHTDIMNACIPGLPCEWCGERIQEDEARQSNGETRNTQNIVKESHDMEDRDESENLIMKRKVKIMSSDGANYVHSA
jgi:hypothetical protein